MIAARHTEIFAIAAPRRGTLPLAGSLLLLICP
ncbi:hypothetical protein M2319_001300 [Rhodobium gokarnense]|uniref:Uncharacterized protein n=1 Tax=Rhodobium gokarnense TaxID=364296 RepID=A0ABT3H9B0_9HYPH|nr:hypothetical protein [Rhodobium gokarnense]